MESPPSDREDLLLDPKADPGGAALGASGAEATVDPRWPVLLRQRVARRAGRSPRHRWWSLTALLAGLLSLNITFTVFVVALPTVRQDFHTNFSVLTWASTGPLLAFGLAAPFFGKAGDLFGHRRLYLFGLCGAMVSAIDCTPWNMIEIPTTPGTKIVAKAVDAPGPPPPTAWPILGNTKRKTKHNKKG